MNNRFLIRSYVVIRALWQRLLNTLLQRQRPPIIVKRILIANFFLFGDVLLLAPLLKTLRAMYPNAEIIVLVRAAYEPLFDQKPYGVQTLVFDPRSFRSIYQITHSGSYDLALVVDDNRYAWLAQAADACWIRGFAKDKPNWKNFLVNEFVDYACTPTAWAEMQLALAKPPSDMSLKPYQAREWLLPSESSAMLSDAFLAQLPQRFALLHVGASSPLKRWSSENWRALRHWLFDTYQLAIVWSAGRGEESWVEEIGLQSIDLSLAGKMSMTELIAVVGRASILISPDTGIAHLGRVANVPTITLFGPGSSIVHGAGVFWSNSVYRAVTEFDMACRNQSVLFRREINWVKRCGRSFGVNKDQCSDAVCMRAIHLNQVKLAVNEVLSH